jgi:hypothetical protein
MRKWLVVGALIMGGGCATTPMPTESERLVPRERILTQKWTASGGNSALLIVKTDRGLMGGGCKITVYVDGEAAAELKHGEMVSLHMPPGEHLLSAKGAGLCGGSGVGETSTSLVDGKSQTYRISFGESGDLHLQPTAF